MITRSCDLGIVCTSHECLRCWDNIDRKRSYRQLDHHIVNKCCNFLSNHTDSLGSFRQVYFATHLVVYFVVMFDIFENSSDVDYGKEQEWPRLWRPQTPTGTWMWGRKLTFLQELFNDKRNGFRIGLRTIDEGRKKVVTTIMLANKQSIDVSSNHSMTWSKMCNCINVFVLMWSLIFVFKSLGGNLYILFFLSSLPIINAFDVVFGFRSRKILRGKEKKGRAAHHPVYLS